MTVLFLWLGLAVKTIRLSLVVVVPSRWTRVSPLGTLIQWGWKLRLILMFKRSPGRLWTRFIEVTILQLLFKHPPIAPVPVGDLTTISPDIRSLLPSTRAHTVGW